MPFTLPGRLTSLLDAVNTCLSAIGVEAVNSVLDNEDIDVSHALNVLREQDLAVQSGEEWEWNKEKGFKLLPDTDGFIFLPDQTLSVDNAYWAKTFNNPCRVTERGNRLYNLEDHTFVFTEGVEVDLTMRLEFEELPEVARRYITILAAQQMQGRFQGSTESNRVVQDDVNRALVALQKHDDRVSDRNLVENNRSVFGALFGRGVVRRRN